MKIVRGPSALEKLAMYGAAADIVDGALLAPGVTSGTNSGAAIICGADAADCFAVKEGLYDYSVAGEDYTVAGTYNNLQLCNLILPGAILAAEYNLAATGVAIATMQSTTSVRITSSEDTIANFWFYVNAGTGKGDLVLCIANDNTDYTLKAAPAVAWIAADTALVKVLSLGHSLHVLSTDRSKLQSTAAAGTARLNTLYSEMKYLGSKGWERLDNIAHSPLYDLDNKNIVFRSMVVPSDGWFGPLA